MKKAILVLAVLSTIAERASATIVVADDFETYNNTAAMNAVWNVATVGPGTLDLGPTGGRTTQSMAHPGGTTQKLNFTGISPSMTTNIAWSFDFYDDGDGNKRETVGHSNSVGTVI